MSDQTRAALDDALAAHVADECDGGMVTAWVGVASVVSAADDEPTTRYPTFGDPQPWHVRAGLVEMLSHAVADDLLDAMGDDQ